MEPQSPSQSPQQSNQPQYGQPPMPPTNQPDQAAAQPAYVQPPADQNAQQPQPGEPQYVQPAQPGQPAQMVYVSRPLDPQPAQVSPEVQQRHEEAKKKYPHLNLSEGEYIIAAVKRHPIGLVQIWGFVGISVIAVLLILGFVVRSASTVSSSFGTAPTGILTIGALLLIVLLLIGGYIGAYVYSANKFYLTNESVIQNIQTSLFSNHEQTVSLSNVEDASYYKKGILQHMLDFGTIRLSTQGAETTYRFHYARDPQNTIATLNNAVEAFKNGRPVSD